MLKNSILGKGYGTSHKTQPAQFKVQIQRQARRKSRKNYVLLAKENNTACKNSSVINLCLHTAGSSEDFLSEPKHSSAAQNAVKLISSLLEMKT